MSEDTVAFDHTSAIPADDGKRDLVIAKPDRDSKLPHLGVVGDTYTILLGGKDTSGRFCLIDMHIPPGGGPPPHRHDVEETFAVLEGELEATFRGKKYQVQAGETINIPANAPHQFHNSSAAPVRMLCTCSPAGLRNWMKRRKSLHRQGIRLAPKHRTELLREPDPRLGSLILVS